MATAISTSIPCEAQLATWKAEDAEGFSGAVRQDVRVLDDSLVVLASLPADRNIALNRWATDEFDRSVPLVDGTTDTEWLSGTPKVVGRQFTVDLGLERLVSRVRILLGKTGLQRPEYFVRGYRIEAATQASPEIWRPLAEQRNNLTLQTDTEIDSTWLFVDDSRSHLARRARFVRLTIISHDRSNWVSLGEVEVFGEGFVEAGEIVGEFEAPSPVNVGRVRWGGTMPEGTDVRLQVRGADAGLAWTDWLDGGTGADSTFGGAEPVTHLQYRGLLGTAVPHETPALENIVIEYDPVLVARKIRDVSVPDTVRKGEPTTVIVSATMDVEADNYGVDRLRLEGICLDVTEARLDGMPLEHDEDLQRGYRWTCFPDLERTLIEFAPGDRIGSGTVTLEVEGKGLFLHDLMPIQVQIASDEQAARDGYTNWQNSPVAAVRSIGLPPDLLGKVDVAPSPFSPFRDGLMSFNFIVANIRDESRMAVEICRLDGHRVKRLVQEGRARAYHFEWDGRDGNGQIVHPGLYLYEIRVQAGNEGARKRGAFAVAY
jgi:hypothetical protein